LNLHLSLASRLDAPHKARAAVTEIERAVDPMTAAKTRLLVSELVANAIRHGEGRVTVDVETSPGGLRAEVTDQGHGFAPPSGDPGLHAESGRGLVLLKRLADSWGVSKGSAAVWFELGRRGSGGTKAGRSRRAKPLTGSAQHALHLETARYSGRGRHLDGAGVEPLVAGNARSDDRPYGTLSPAI